MNHARFVSAHMSAITHSVGPQATLAEAQQRMRELVVHQLPVVDDAGQPCGVLLERDLHIARQLGAAFDTVTIGSIIPRAQFSVKPDETLVGAVRTMASRAAPNALVVDGAKVSGVLTTQNVLRVLADLLEAQDSAARQSLPAQAAPEASASQGEEDADQSEQTAEVEEAPDSTRVQPVQARSADGVPLSMGDAPNPRSRAEEAEEPGAPTIERSSISPLDEGYLLERVQDYAGKLSASGSESDADELEKAVRELHDAQATLLASERQELAATRDAEPLHRTRLEKLSEERSRHTQALAAVLLDLDRRSKPTSAIAGHALQAATALRTYIERERDPLRFVS